MSQEGVTTVGSNRDDAQEAAAPVPRPFVPYTPTWKQRLAAWVLTTVGRAVIATLRYRWVDPTDYLSGRDATPMIYCLWHNRLAVVLPLYANDIRPRNRAAGLAALVSASRDGAFLAAVMECFGIEPVRGSSSRRGPRALLELTNWAEKRYNLAITPDGPRGPAGVVQGGVMVLAQATGLPILPFSYSARWKIRLNSWDRFMIPLPFSRCEMRLGTPLHVPADATDEQRETLRLQLETALNRLSGD